MGKDIKHGKPEVWKVEFREDVMVCSWTCKGIGFGQLDIMVNRAKGTLLTDLVCDAEKDFLIATECMGEEFAKEILSSAVEYLIKNSSIIE